MHRQRNKPDTRLDWRDPNMPVIRRYVYADGSVRESVDPAYESRFSEHRLATGVGVNWRDDPTYNMKKERR